MSPLQTMPDRKRKLSSILPLAILLIATLMMMLSQAITIASFPDMQRATRAVMDYPEEEPMTPAKNTDNSDVTSETRIMAVATTEADAEADDTKLADNEQSSIRSYKPTGVSTKKYFKNVKCPAEDFGELWSFVCRHDFTEAVRETVKRHDFLQILQVGAHKGFESNDPFAGGMLEYLKGFGKYAEQLVEYTFIEASPTSFSALKENVKQYSHLGEMVPLNMGVIPDLGLESNTKSEDETLMTFYSISDTIDIDTGYDSLSGKQLPFWISQVSSFSLEHVMSHQVPFRKNGLKMRDYIVETKIKTLGLSHLLQERPADVFLLIDTEGLDCDLVAQTHVALMPKFVFYEILHCSSEKAAAAATHLELGGYQLVNMLDNVLAYRT